jgi:hypothetical protein
MTIGILLAASWLGTRPEQRRLPAAAAASPGPEPVAAAAS